MTAELKGVIGDAYASIGTLGEILGALVHELRGPLATVSATAGLMVLEAPPGAESERLKARVAVIRRSVQVMDEVLDDLCDLTAAAQGQLGVERRPVLVASLIAEAVAEARARRRSRPVEVEIPAEAVRVLCDRAHICKALVRLIDSALWAAPEGVPVSATAEAGVGGSVRLGVVGAADPRAQGHCAYCRAVAAALIAAHGGVLQDGRTNAGARVVSFALPAA